MIYYLYLLCAVVLMALQFSVNKFYQSKNGSGIMTSLLYTTLSGFATGAIFFAINGFTLNVTPFSFVCAVGIASLCLGYSLLGFKIFSLGNFAVYTMFLMLGGMLLPFLYGLFFLGDAETLSPISLVCRIIGVLLLIVSMLFQLTEKKETEDKHDKKTRLLFIALCLLVFFMNGFVSILSKLHQIEGHYPTVDNNSFVFLTNTINGIFSGFALFILTLFHRGGPKLSPSFKPWMLISSVAVYALCNGVSYLLQLLAAASTMPASVQYPMMTGGSVVLTALTGYLFFGEKQSRRALIGTILAFAATFLFLF